jgi:hypothetical protein
MKRLRPPGIERSRRRGTFIIVAVICLVLATSLVGVLLSLVQKHRRQIAFQQAELQAEWLVESAIDRSAFRLQRDHDYQGETWAIEASELAGGPAAEIVVDIKHPTDRPDARTVEVKAVYGSGPGQTVSRARQATVILSQEN